MIQRVTILLVVSVFLFFGATPLQAADKIRVAVTTIDVGFLSGGVALRKNFFRDEGLDVDLIRMNAAVSVTALANGDIDYSMAFGSVIRGAMIGLPVRVVTGLLDRATHVLLSRPQYKNPQELKGKTLGISSFGAAADVVARLMIKHFGVDPEKEMKIVALGPAQSRFTALKEGLVDVIVISPPADSEGKKLGYNILARAYDLFSFPNVGLGASNKKIVEKRDEVKRTAKALIRANRYIRQDREGTIKVLAEWGRTLLDYAAASYDASVRTFAQDGSIPEDGLRTVIDQAKISSQITKNIQISDVADLAILREIQRELGVVPPAK